MGVTVRVRSEPDAMVVHLAGPADPDLLARVGDAVARTRSSDASVLVLDVSDLTLIHPRAVTALVDNIPLESGEVPRVVCRRHSGRRLVRRAGVSALVFNSVSAALAHRAKPASRPAALLDAVADAVSDAVADTAPAPVVP